MRLKNKVAIVTGSTSGIGESTARIMATEGASVVISGRNEERAKRVAGEIKASGGKALAIKFDLGNEADIKRMVETTIAEFGRIDILVNNAAYLGGARLPFHEIEVTEWKREIDTSIGGTLILCRSVIPQMLKQKNGRIITVCSDAGKQGNPRLSIYSLCKAGLAGWSRAMAAELATEGITVNCVSPGQIVTPTIAKAMKNYPGIEKTWPPIPMVRLGKPEEIGYMIAFLASDEASYITGQDYSVDGGMTL